MWSNVGLTWCSYHACAEGSSTCSTAGRCTLFAGCPLLHGGLQPPAALQSQLQPQPAAASAQQQQQQLQQQQQQQTVAAAQDEGQQQQQQQVAQPKQEEHALAKELDKVRTHKVRLASM